MESEMKKKLLMNGDKEMLFRIWWTKVKNSH